MADRFQIAAATHCAANAAGPTLSAKVIQGAFSQMTIGIHRGADDGPNVILARTGRQNWCMLGGFGAPILADAPAEPRAVMWAKKAAFGPFGRQYPMPQSPSLGTAACQHAAHHDGRSRT